MELLNSGEAAAYLRLKERKLYELVAQRAVPCTKVTGRWLFPKAALDRWVAADLARAGFAEAEAPPIVGGSHDPLLEWALRESGSGLAVLAEGSEAGLARLDRREVMAAAVHLHALENDRDANLASFETRPDAHGHVLLAFARREQGLIVPAGNPRGLNSISDAAQAGLRIAQRPRGAGAQLLLLALLHRAGITGDGVLNGPLCPTGPDVAHAVQSDRADCGIASRAVAQAAKLGFVPLLWEHFDLLMRQRDYFQPPLQKLFAFMRTKKFTERAQEMTGYDVSECGSVRYVS
jgi:putative molybdopterin biosynthesis protein